MVYAKVSKTFGRKAVGVRVSPQALECLIIEPQNLIKIKNFMPI